MLFVNPNEKLHIAGLTFKVSEGSSEANKDDEHDVDAYLLLGDFNGSMFNVSGDITHVNWKEQVGDKTILNISVRGDVMAGPAKIWGDYSYQIGVDQETAPAKDIDKRAYAIAIGGDLNIDALKLWLVGGIGSGDDGKKADEDDSYVTLLSSDSRNAPFNTFVYDYTTKASAGTNIFTGDRKNVGISNLTAVQIGAKHKTTEKLSLDGTVTYLQATEDVAIRGGKADSDLGTEIDARIKYKLSKNLTYFIEGGYLLAGDAYKDAAGKDPEDPYRIRHGLVLNF